FPERHRPWEQEGHFKIENNEEDRDQIEPDVELHPGVVESVESALIRRKFLWIGLLEGNQERRDQQNQTDQGRDPDKHHEWKVVLQDAGHRRRLFPAVSDTRRFDTLEL